MGTITKYERTPTPTVPPLVGGWRFKSSKGKDVLLMTEHMSTMYRTSLQKPSDEGLTYVGDFYTASFQSFDSKQVFIPANGVTGYLKPGNILSLAKDALKMYTFNVYHAQYGRPPYPTHAEVIECFSELCSDLYILDEVKEELKQWTQIPVHQVYDQDVELKGLGIAGVLVLTNMINFTSDRKHTYKTFRKLEGDKVITKIEKYEMISDTIPFYPSTNYTFVEAKEYTENAVNVPRVTLAKITELFGAIF